MGCGRLKRRGPNFYTIVAASDAGGARGRLSKSVIGGAHCYLMNLKDGHGRSQKEGRGGHSAQVAGLAVWRVLLSARSGLTVCLLLTAASLVRRAGRLAGRTPFATTGLLSGCTAISSYDAGAAEGQGDYARLGVVRTLMAPPLLVRARRVTLAISISMTSLPNRRVASA